MKRHIILAALVASTLGAQAQEWHDTGNSAVIPGFNFLGSINNAPLDFHTGNVFRARINQRVQYSLLNGFPNIPADGFTLITPDDGFLHQAPKGPFSRLHLAEGGEDGNAQQWGYRPWQRNGVTFTGNDDQGYVGQKYNNEDHESDLTDMVIQWSDNPGNWKGDRMRFIFTSGYDPGATTGMKSEEGLEGMRLFPTVEQGINVGVGDFFADGNSDPTERLHILDGRVRIEELPDNDPAPDLTKFMVVDDMDPNSDEYGVVKWRYLPVVPPPAPSCDWSLNPASHNNVSTAFGAFSSTCPDNTDAVGIGVDLGGGAAAAKLNVVTNDFASAVDISSTSIGVFNTGINLLATGATTTNRGLKIDAHGAAINNYGVDVITDGASTNAIAGFFSCNDNASYSVGVLGTAAHGGLTRIIQLKT